jgi:hypothetical protein
MMIHAGTPASFWGDAMTHASYIKNRLPRTEGEKKTPTELMYGQIPQTALLKPFGCQAYAYIPELRQTKFGPRGQQGIYLGVARGTKAYKVALLEDLSCQVTKHVKFNETVFPFKTGERSIEVENINERFSSENDDEFESESDSQPVYNSTFNTDDSEPRTITEAQNRPDWNEWKIAIDKELASHKENETWKMVPTPQGKNIVGCKWVFKIKRNPDGSIDKYKARLVARGFTQREGVDYDETFAPVMKFHTLRIILAICIQHNLMVHQMDVVTAFLNGVLDYEVYMESPTPEEGKVCLLKKALYGLKQAGRRWYEKIDESLRASGYTRLNSDHSVYIRNREDINRMVIIGIYVDDVVICCRSSDIINQVKEALRNEYKMTDGGEIKYILGIQVLRTGETLQLSQSHYIRELIREYLPENDKVEKSPLVIGYKPGESQTTRLTEREHSRYRKIVGSLQYASQGTRPDITFAVQFLSRSLHAPTNGDLRNAERTLRYLRKTQNLVLEFRHKTMKGRALLAFSDADHAGDLTDRKSTSGVVLTLYGTPVMWQSKKQEIVTDSTTYAEYVAMYHATKDIVWARLVLSELSFEEKQGTPLYVDNAAAKELVENPKFHKRTKHIDVKYHFTREHQSLGTIAVQSIGTANQLADILTKAFGPHKQEEAVKRLNLIDEKAP